VDLLWDVVSVLSSSGRDNELFYLVKLREFLGELLSFLVSGLKELGVILVELLAVLGELTLPSKLDLPIYKVSKGWDFISSSFLLRSKGD